MQTPSSTSLVSTPQPRADADADPVPGAGFIHRLPPHLQTQAVAQIRRLALRGAQHKAELRAMAATVAGLPAEAAAAERAGFGAAAATAYSQRLPKLWQLLALYERQARQSQARRLRAQWLFWELRAIDEEEGVGLQALQAARNEFNSVIAAAAAAPWDNN